MPTKSTKPKAPKAAAPAETAEPKPTAWAGFKEAAMRRKVGPIIELDPVTLKPHPLLERFKMRGDLVKHLGDLRHYKDEAKEQECSWTAFCDDVKTRGVTEPVRVSKVDGVWMILDGRHRAAAGVATGLRVIPCIEERGEDAVAIILGALIHRKRVTLSAVAYSFVLMHPELAVENKAGRPSKKANPAKTAGLTQPEAAQQAGVSLRYIEEACQTYRELAAKPEDRAHFEPLIIHGLCALGDARTGAASQTRKTKKPAVNYYMNTVESVKGLTHWAAQFEKLKDAERVSLAADLAEEAAKWPDEFRAVMALALAKGMQS